MKTVSDESTLRRVAQGLVRGTRAPNGALVWRGIPYAAKPLGSLRWKAPRPAESWLGERLSVENAEPCVQDLSLAHPFTDHDGDGLVGTEDCLYLNVFAPREARAGQHLPVMYFIHGGGNVGGHNAAPTYDASHLAQQHRVVVVTINYRLGLLGWFMHPALAGAGSSADDRSGNWGTLDIIAGLEWVRDNVEAFGGDPSNVTIFGESAGGQNVFSLLVSPRAKGLFHRAISQSGGLAHATMQSACNYMDEPAPGSAASSREIVNQLLVRHGLASNRADAKLRQNRMPPFAIAELLRATDIRELLAIVNPNRVRLYDAPRLLGDGAVLPAEPWRNALRSGRFNRVPVITGTNRDERRFYQHTDPAWLEVLRECPNDYVLYAHYMTLGWKLHAVDEVARALTAGGQREIYAYRFDWDEQGTIGSLDMSLALGAAHSVELPFVFGTADGLTVPMGDAEAPGRRALSASMMSYWAEFAYSGNPGRGRSEREPAWTRWTDDEGQPKLMVFDTVADGGVRMSSESITRVALKQGVLEECAFAQPELHPRLYRELFHGRAFEEAEYRKLLAATRPAPPAIVLETEKLKARVEDGATDLRPLHAAHRPDRAGATDPTVLRQRRLP
ncbi:MAG TPA: carboxylesterase family protein [Polyangiales bacterium]|nr:carboxylesterase family protein [Polyangiales bacterium]